MVVRLLYSEGINKGREICNFNFQSKIYKSAVEDSNKSEEPDSIYINKKRMNRYGQIITKKSE